jgi:hypothetical protein
MARFIGRIVASAELIFGCAVGHLTLFLLCSKGRSESQYWNEATEQFDACSNGKMVCLE